MSVHGLEDFSNDRLIQELINRQTFLGVIVFHREAAEPDHEESGEMVVTKSPRLSRKGVEVALRRAVSLLPSLPGEEATATTGGLPVCSFPLLRSDESGSIRIGKSRITLDLVIEQYDNGMTPEEMVRAYDTLELADVYAAIAYYLTYQEEVRAYLKRRHDESETVRSKVETEHPRVSREELLSRQRAAERADAPTGK